MSTNADAGELSLVAELRDGHALDQLHHGERPTTFGVSGIYHASDIGVVHFRQGLPLGLEAVQNRLESNPALITATDRLTGSVCWAMKTDPIPPSPI